MASLHKKNFKALEKICRFHWNGDVNECDCTEGECFPYDEYDSYIPQTIKLILAGANEQAFIEHIEYVHYQMMGLNGGESNDSWIRELASKFVAVSKEVEKALEMQYPIILSKQ